MNADRGSISLLVVGIALVTGLAFLTTALAAGAVVRSRAESVADVVALAAAGALLEDPGPCHLAAATARRNSADLLSCHSEGAVVKVQVAVATPTVVSRISSWDRVDSTAAAELLPPILTVPGRRN